MAASIDTLAQAMARRRKKPPDPPYRFIPGVGGPAYVPHPDAPYGRPRDRQLYRIGTYKGSPEGTGMNPRAAHRYRRRRPGTRPTPGSAYRNRTQYN